MIDRRHPTRSQTGAGYRPASAKTSRTTAPAGRSYNGGSTSNAGSQSLLVVAWRGRWIILVCTIATLAAGLGYIHIATPIYTSTAKLYLHCESIQISQYEAGGMPRTDKYLHTQAEILRSRDILGAALEPEEDTPLRTFEDVEVPLAYVRENIEINVGRKDETIGVSFGSPYPAEASDIVNRVVAAYMDSQKENDRQDAANALKIFESRLTACEAELKTKETELHEFRDKHMTVSQGMNDGTSFRQGFLECQRDYRQAQDAASQAKLYLDGVRALAESPQALHVYVLSQQSGPRYETFAPARRVLEDMLIQLNRRRAELLRWSTNEHQAVVAVDTEKRRVQHELDALDAEFVDVTIRTAERGYADAKATEDILTARYEQENEKMRLLSAELQQYDQLQAEVSRLETEATEWKRQVSEIAKIVDESAGRMRMAMLEFAVPTQQPSSPQKGKIMALALLAGFAIGGGISAARDRADQTFHSVDEVSAALDVSVLGAVPAMSRREKVQTRGQKVLLQPDSPEAEAYRTVRTALFFGIPMEEMRTVLVTSPAAGDGKSTLVANLAISMAQAGQNTLILDADLRRPMQHEIFSLDHRERSLKSVFAGQMELAEAIQPTTIGRLSLLTCGHGVSNPAELLNSSWFSGLLEELAKTYDRVLVDAPPVTLVTDAQILGALCDYTVLVMRVDRSSRRIVRRAIDALDSVGASLFGVVINAVRSGGDGYGYGYYGRAAQYRSAYRPDDGGNGAKGGPDHISSGKADGSRIAKSS